ncbi:hypothetical protein [Deinococcus sp. AJ005]|uniref:hypothetical protein n=1 Tax=Deinococcus sp. AJ005 TaxID=2652443 RepID=UPI00125CCE0E|nr:hypothetical protein [Deinococcus sp. AJ005]QFP76970.1 hypothetical protein DAAJ005_11270 [Deinococcus sp. AJ005]
MRLRALALAGLVLASGAVAQNPPGLSADLKLMPSYGGAVLTGRIGVSRPDEVLGVWSSLGRARLMKCSPRCEVVTSVPITGSLILSGSSGYRVVLGGSFKPGQKVSIVMRFRQGVILNTSAIVNR